jgi:hypothetical protein
MSRNVYRSVSVPGKPSLQTPGKFCKGGISVTSVQINAALTAQRDNDLFSGFLRLFSALFSDLHRLFLRRRILLILFVPAIASRAAGEELIADPIADYLAMKVPDRVTNAGPLLIIKKVEVDLEGNGTRDVFVGTWYRHSGPNTWLWSGYAPVAGGYKRITPADTDVLIDFDGIYVGDLPEIGRHGMAQAYSLELDNKDRNQSNMISDITFYYVDHNELIQEGTGAVDRDDPKGEAEYEFYFGPDRKISSAPQIESFTVQELASKGYRIPAAR